MKNTSALCIAIAGLVLVVGCGDDSTGPGEGGGDLFPVSVGNTWHYQASGYQVYGGDTTEVTGEVWDEVTDQTTHAEGFDLYEFVEIADYSYQGAPDTSKNYVAFESGQVRCYDDTASTEYLILIQYPLELGATWYEDPSDTTKVVTVMDMSVDVNVPAGSFSNCVYLRKTTEGSPEDYEDAYLAPGVGRVRMLYHHQDESYSSHLLLQLDTYQVQ